MSMKNSSDTIGNRSRDLPVCSASTTTPPRGCSARENNNNNNNNNKVTILWNQQIKTDRTIPSNKPGIVTRNYENGTCMLIDVAIPGDRKFDSKRS
jgi:hypothetical protein